MPMSLSLRLCGALDNSVAGEEGVVNRQWIEIHNRLSVPLPLAGLSIHIKSGRPGDDQISKADVATKLNDAKTEADPQGTTVLDWMSNVDGNGWGGNTPPGQNGFAIAADATDITNRVDFVSMYRNRGKLGKTEGATLGHWIASTNVYRAGYKGTPGAAERTGPKGFSASGVSLDVVFSEVANRKTANKDYEWIELLILKGDPNFKNWRVSIVEVVDKQTELFTLPELNKTRFDDILVITATDPKGDEDHPLAAGYDVSKKIEDQTEEGRDESIRYYVADWKTELPDDKEFVLILRSNKDKTNHETVVDIAGYVKNLSKNTADFDSSQWPLIGHGAPASDKNKFVEDTVQRRQHTGILGTGTTHGDKKDDQVAYVDAGWTGIGYKRNADADVVNGGTPGYPNNALRSNNDADAIAAVMISEVMAIAGSRNLPEWIELQNMSDSIGVNLNGWRLTIVNHNEDGTDGEFAGKLTHTITFDGDDKIPPGQNFLVTARRGRNDTNLPKERIENPDPILKRGDPMLNPYGFQVKLEAKKDANYFFVDEVGNLGLAPATSRRTDARSFEDLAWELPALINDDGDRISLVRVGDDGTKKGSLLRFDMSNQIDSVVDPTSYGHDTDQGSPGHHPGGVLPVSLSKFRPERMKDTGAVVVRWITESETNNAGFNILRSDTRDGQFTKLNTKLIAGQGTTSARTVYEYADTSAKPNVIYYYQIQDVSLDGQVTPLAITHLRGNVTAAGKLTTTWAELKALQ